MEFVRQEHWSGLPFPTPGDLPNPGMEPVPPSLAGRFFSTVTPGKPLHNVCVSKHCFTSSMYTTFICQLYFNKADIIFKNFKLKNFKFNLKKKRNENRVIDED